MTLIYCNDLNNPKGQGIGLGNLAFPIVWPVMLERNLDKTIVLSVGMLLP
jgi:hypothetical protein